MRDMFREELRKERIESGVGGPGAQQQAQTNQAFVQIQQQLTALSQVATQLGNLQNVRANEAALNVSHGYMHPDNTTRQVPVDFTLSKTTVIVGWRFWKLGNRTAGASKQPVWPYEKLTSVDFAKGARAAGLPSWRSTSQVFSKWRKVFKYLEGQLSATDTVDRKWQVDGPTHYLTLNRLGKLIPKKVSTYSIDSCHNSITTIYNIMCVQQKALNE